MPAARKKVAKHRGQVDLEALADLHGYLDEVEGALQSYFKVDSCVLTYEVSEDVDAICTWDNGSWRVELEVK